MHKLFPIATITLFLIAQSCATKETGEDVPIAHEAINIDFTKTFQGTIDGQYGIVMTLNRKENILSGSYSYNSQGIPIKIYGTIDNDYDIVINEFNDQGSIIGIFNGQLVEDEINGEWSIPDRSKTMSFSLSEFEKSTENEAISAKKELLTALIGEHKLVAIDGSMGVNTMVEYSLTDGIWNASESSISFNDETDAPMREGYDIDLKSDELQKMNSMKIVVSPNLQVSLVCNGKTYIRILFKENGMDYELANSPKEYIWIPEELTRKTTFINNELYLFAKNYTSPSKLEQIDLLLVYADVAIISCSKKYGFSVGFHRKGDNSTYKFE